MLPSSLPVGSLVQHFEVILRLCSSCSPAIHPAQWTSVFLLQPCIACLVSEESYHHLGVSVCIHLGSHHTYYFENLFLTLPNRITQLLVSVKIFRYALVNGKTSPFTLKSWLGTIFWSPVSFGGFLPAYTILLGLSQNFGLPVSLMEPDNNCRSRVSCWVAPRMPSTMAEIHEQHRNVSHWLRIQRSWHDERGPGSLFRLFGIWDWVCLYRFTGPPISNSRTLAPKVGEAYVE